MKIAIIMSRIYTKPGGGAKVIFEYANYFARDGYEVVIYSLSNGNFYNKPIPKWLKGKAAHLLGKVVGTSNWFKFEKGVKQITIDDIFEITPSDYIIATAIETAIEVNKLNDSYGKKFYFIQDFENWNYSNNEVYASYSAGMTNIVVAKWLKEIVDEHSSTPSYLVSNCINIELFNDKGLKRRKHSIVFHYRSADYKGPRYALEAIRKLKDKYNDLTVDVISREDRPEDLPKFYNFHHSISASEVAEINNRTEVFMCTSIEEGFGLPGLEAMACGCAVVSSSYRGVFEYVADGKNALLSPVRDVDAMVENIVKLFEDDELRKKIAENGIKTGKERSLEKSAKEFESILMEEYEK